MQPHSLMKKSAFKTRRQIILYILISVLVLGLVMGFTDPFTTDNSVHKASVGETIVMEQEPPESGTPEDYDLITNLKFAAYKLHHASFFRGVTDGVAAADLGVTSYIQRIHNTRVAKDTGVVFAETISSSSLKSVAEQKYAVRSGDNAVVIFRPSVSVNGDSATFASDAYAMTYEQYSSKYGTIPDQLSKYVINEKTILSVNDKNAKATTTGNGVRTSSDDQSNGVGFDFYVPDTLVKGDDGYYTFSLELDPATSAIYYRNEMRTLAGADQNPNFNSVNLTVVIDDNWNPVSVTTVENYDIAIPVLGAMNCTGTLTEVFTDISDDNGVVPEEDFFLPLVEQALKDPNFAPTEIPNGPSSPADYLATAFGDYLTGAKNLDLTADITSELISAYNLKLSLNLDTMDIRAMLGDLYVRFADDRVYIDLNDIHGYIDTADLNAILENAIISDILDGGAATGGLDLTVLFGGDILEKVFEHCEMTSENGVTCIRLPFALDLTSIMPALGSAEIDASIYIDDADMSLLSIVGKIKLLGYTIDISAKPATKAFKFPSTDGAANLKGVVDFIPDILNTAASETYGISGTVSAMGQSFGIDAYIDRTDGLAVDAVITVLGQDVKVKLLGDSVFIGIGKIDVRGTMDELPVLFDAIEPIVGANMGDLMSKLSLVMPSSLTDYIDMLESLNADDDTLDIKLNILTAPAELTLSRSSGRLDGLKFDYEFDKFGIYIDAHAALNISAPDRRAVIAPDGKNFITFAELARIIDKLDKYADSDGNYSASVDGNVTVENRNHPLIGNFDIDTIVSSDSAETDRVARGNVTVLGQDINVVYYGGTTYIKVKNLAFKLSATDAENIFASADGIISSFIDTITTPDTPQLIGMLLDVIESVTVDGDIIKIEIAARNADIRINADIENNKISIDGVLYGYPVKLDVTLVLTEDAHGITVPDNAEDYVDAAFLADALGTVNRIIEQNGMTADIDITIDGVTYTAALSLSVANDRIALNVSETDHGFDMTVIDNKAYISLGDIKTVGEISDIESLLKTLKPVIPPELSGDIENMLVDLDIEVMLDKALDALKVKQLPNGDIETTVVCDGFTVSVAVPSKLDRITANIDYGNRVINATIANITPTSVTVIAPNETQYVSASELIKALSPFVTIANDAVNARSLSLDINGALNGYVYKGDGDEKTAVPTYTDIKGAVSLSFSNGISACANITVGDMPVSVVIKDGVLYLSVNTSSDNRIDISSQLTESALDDILEDLDVVMPGIKTTVKDIIRIVKETTVKDLIGMISLSPVADGFKLALDASKLNVYVGMTIITDADKFTSASVDVTAFGMSFGTTLIPLFDNDSLTGFTAGGTDEIYDLTLTFTAAAQNGEISIADPSRFVPVGNITAFIPPVMRIANDFADARSIELDLSALALISNDKQTEIGGKVLVNFDPLAVSANLILFKGTGSDSETELNITYINGIVYIQSGNIKLSFDTNADIATVLEVLDKYLPTYIVEEIAKLMGASGTSAFNNIMLIADRIGQIIAANGDARNIIGILFSPLGGVSVSGKSTIKSICDTVSVFERTAITNGATEKQLVVSATLFGYTFNIAPHLALCTTDDGIVSAIETLSVDTNFDGTSVRIDINRFTPYDTVFTNIAAPVDVTDYIPVIEFVKTLDNAVNTLTSTHAYTDAETGEVFEDITFEIDNFEFDYYIYAVETDENGNPITDAETGRQIPVIKDGQKVIDKHVIVSRHNVNDNTKSLKFKFEQYAVRDDNGNVVKDADNNTVKKYRLNLEAHITLDIGTACTFDGNGNHSNHGSGNTLPIDLDLYVINNDEYPDGFAFVDYMESSNNGERISIDYTSIMQLAAAVMDILGVDKDVSDQLLGDYKQTLDTSVFESMNIAALNGISSAIENIVKAANHGTTALDLIADAWDIFYNVDTKYKNDYDGDTAIDKLNSALPDILDLATKAMTEINKAAALFGMDVGPDEPEIPSDDRETVSGALYNKIVNGLTFTNTDGVLKATVDGKLITDTDTVDANVAVTQSNNRIDSITVKDLDVNTALLKTFNAPFTSGQEVNISLPENFDGNINSNGKIADYSNLANIKHLLFDVMNTANMLEFEIGDGVNDKIDLDINIGIHIQTSILYNVKVMIIDQGENASPRYKTAAAIEFTVPHYTFIADILPPCTTRLFFYDDVLYISGVKGGWSVDNTIVANKKTILGISYGDKANVLTADFVDVAYTLDELAEMFSSGKDGMTKFFKQFLFYLIPLRESVVGIDIHGKIIDAIYSGSGDIKLKTPAQIFKGYSYADGEHKLTIGLKELGQDNNLGDLFVTLKGENDGDSNILDNYITSATIKTSFVNMVNLSLSASLINTKINYYTDKDFSIPSPENEKTEYGKLGKKDLFTTCLATDRKLYTYKGVDYYSADNKFSYGNCYALTDEQRVQLTVQDIINTQLGIVDRDPLGNVISITNRANGIKWTGNYVTA